MTQDRIEDIIKTQIKGKQGLSYSDDGDIVYLFDKKEYRIGWDKTWTKYGHSVAFTSKHIKNFKLHKSTINYNHLIITEASIEKNNKNVLAKIRILVRRITEQLEINEFVSNANKQDKKLIIRYISKDLGVSITDMVYNFDTNENWYRYRSYDTKKIKIDFSDFSYNVRLQYNEVNYVYSFTSNHPCKWNVTKIKFVVLDSKNETYDKPKKITNIIRYAKLKKLFAKNG
jgi:hypothetical protein